MAKMSLTAEGSGANPGKIMFYLGVLFVVMGALIGGGALVGVIASGELGMLMFALIFLALVPGSVSSMHIEQEDDLMNPDFDPSGMMPSVGVSCPNCGANIVVPIGMARFCPYCNSKVSA